VILRVIATTGVDNGSGACSVRWVSGTLVMPISVMVYYVGSASLIFVAEVTTRFLRNGASLQYNSGMLIIIHTRAVYTVWATYVKRPDSTLIPRTVCDTDYSGHFRLDPDRVPV
jgi:hypothetical protein